MAECIHGKTGTQYCEPCFKHAEQTGQPAFMAKMVPQIPAVIHAPNTADSISTERALKQVHELLEEMAEAAQAADAVMKNTYSANRLSKIEASIDDVQTMIQAIDQTKR